MSKKLSVKDRAMLAMHTPAVAPARAGLTDPAPAVKTKTGPGAFVAHLARESEVFSENQSLKTELKVWSDAAPAKKLDPVSVLPSKWANRHSDSFESTDFKALKADIESAGGNVQAIKVRPVPGSQPQGYEIVFGHRRHRACLELGLPVLAVIESINEQALFVEMDRENRQRADLRPYEQGEMYRRALDDGLYGSLRKLADAIGVQAPNVSVAVKIARLPAEVLDAFPSRLDIQYRWAAPLSDALEKDPDVVLARAKTMKAEKKTIPKSAVEVYQALVGTPKNALKTASREIKVDGATVMLVRMTEKKVSFEIDVLSADKVEKVQRAILQALAD
ncbi:MAG: ParB/RepB/Spo0J family partition protein [Pseudomonadota bacterium]|nr:ParB/RepB/Spo0J family partition protein [Pseudomonadota bacterium]